MVCIFISESKWLTLAIIGINAWYFLYGVILPCLTTGGTKQHHFRKSHGQGVNNITLDHSYSRFNKCSESKWLLGLSSVKTHTVFRILWPSRVHEVVTRHTLYSLLIIFSKLWFIFSKLWFIFQSYDSYFKVMIHNFYD